MFFKYFLVVMFCLFIIKSAARGFTSELISLIGTTIASGVALFAYKPGVKYAIISIAIFSVIQALGLYIAFSNRRFGYVQTVFGACLGALKFLLLLIVVTSIVLATNITSPAAGSDIQFSGNNAVHEVNLPQQFVENSVIKAILPYSSAIKWMFVKLG